MIDYEDLMLNTVDSDSMTDDCTGCPYKGVHTCKNQCMEIVEIYNRNLIRWLEAGRTSGPVA